jgi:hypothetical protein
MSTTDTEPPGRTHRRPADAGVEHASPGADIIQIWTLEQLASGLGVSLRTLMRWHHCASVHPRNCFGGVRLFRKATTESWLKAREEPEARKGRRA